MAHIAFLNIPDAGHINPTLGLVTELTNRGHHTTYTATQPFTTPITTAGAKLVPYRSTLAKLLNGTRAAEHGQFTAQDFAEILRAQLRETATTLPPLARAFAADLPDVVVYDDPLSWTGRLLAARWGVPAVRSRTTLAANGSWSLAAEYADLDLEGSDVPALLRGVARLLRRVNVAITPAQLIHGSESIPSLVYIPRAFQPFGETFGAPFHFVGPCLDARGREGIWKAPRDGRPLAIVSLGTVYTDAAEFFRTCVQAFAGLPWHTVISLGGRVDPAHLGSIPSHVEVHRRIPQLDVLRHADVFVCHAGLTSTMESLYFGVPIVAVPQMSEQRTNAGRIVELGLGRRLGRGDVTARALRDTAESVRADRSIRTHVHGMQAEIHASGGAPAAADVVESLLAARIVEGAQ